MLIHWQIYIQENLQKLMGALGFLSLDAAKAFHAVLIEPDSRDCTVFISGFGTLLDPLIVRYNFVTVSLALSYQ